MGLYVYDTVNTTTVVVLYFVSLYITFCYNYKIWAHQCLKTLGKETRYSFAPFSSAQAGVGGVTVMILHWVDHHLPHNLTNHSYRHPSILVVNNIE